MLEKIGFVVAAYSPMPASAALASVGEIASAGVATAQIVDFAVAVATDDAIPAVSSFV